MAIRSRQELVNYCLRALGAPVIEINVDASQLNDRIEDALDYWHLYHYEGMDSFPLLQRIRASRITIDQPIADEFKANSYIEIQNKPKVKVVAEAGYKREPSVIPVINATDVSVGDTFQSPNGTTVTVTKVLIQEYDNRCIEMPDHVYGVTSVSNIGKYWGDDILFDVEYQLHLNDLWNLSAMSMSDYSVAMSHLNTLDLQLNGHNPIRFNRLTNKLYLDVDWTELMPGQTVLLEAYRAIDPDEFNKVWNEIWMRRYATALIKKQWANNLKKFQGIQMPGGVTFDGQLMFDEATAEIQDLEEDLREKSSPLDFWMG